MNARERIKNMAKKIAKYAPFAWAVSFLFLWTKILSVRFGNISARISMPDEAAFILLLLASSIILLHVLVKIIALFKGARDKDEVNWKKMFMQLALLLIYAASLSVATYITFAGRTLQGIFA